MTCFPEKQRSGLLKPCFCVFFLCCLSVLIFTDTYNFQYSKISQTKIRWSQRIQSSLSSVWCGVYNNLVLELSHLKYRNGKILMNSSVYPIQSYLGNLTRRLDLREWRATFAAISFQWLCFRFPFCAYDSSVYNAYRVLHIGFKLS